jgi:hypothetical protein
LALTSKAQNIIKCEHWGIYPNIEKNADHWKKVQKCIDMHLAQLQSDVKKAVCCLLQFCLPILTFDVQIINSIDVRTKKGSKIKRRLPNDEHQAIFSLASAIAGKNICVTAAFCSWVAVMVCCQTTA